VDERQFQVFSQRFDLVHYGITGKLDRIGRALFSSANFAYVSVSTLADSGQFGIVAVVC
jgi:hypothetical protein